MVFTSQFTVGDMSNYVSEFRLAYVQAGSAPDISGKGLVNPIAMVLSLGMMLKYSLQQPALAEKVDRAVKNTIDKGVNTADIGGSSTTSEVGDAIAKELETILK